MTTRPISPDAAHRKSVLAGSNYLTDLAARIWGYHEATVAALKASVIHAMSAGDLLTEAKAQLKHGLWLPWLAKNCAISERTAQLYMKLAKNRAIIEKSATASADLDLSINEACALIVLAGRIEKLIEFAKRAETTTPDDLVNLCVAHGFGVIIDEGYDPFYGRSEIEQRDWILFGWFIGNGSESAFDHVEWLLQRPFQNVEEWLGPEGDKFRTTWGMPAVSDKCRAAWAKFHADHSQMTSDDILAELKRIRAEYYARKREAA